MPLATCSVTVIDLYSRGLLRISFTLIPSQILATVGTACAANVEHANPRIIPSLISLILIFYLLLFLDVGLVVHPMDTEFVQVQIFHLDIVCLLLEEQIHLFREAW